MTAPSLLADFIRARPLRFGLAADIHPSRWEVLGIPAAGAERLAGCPRACATLSKRLDWLLPEAPDEITGWEGALAAKPGVWALLPGVSLWRAGKRLGAGRYRPEIARLIRRAEVAAFKAAAGDDAYSFALKQAPVLWRVAPLAGAAEIAGGETLAGRVLATAGLGLGCWLAALPAELAARARMKFPPTRDSDFIAAAAWPEERRAVWLAALARVLALEG